MCSQVVTKRGSVSKYIHVSFPHNILVGDTSLAFAARLYAAKSGAKRDKCFGFSNLRDRGKATKIIFLLEYF